MLLIIGTVIVFVCVFGAYILAGGKMGIVLHALPHEMMTIGGAAVGAFLISNKGVVIKKTLKDLGKTAGDGKWKKQDYQDLLAMLFATMKLARTKGMLALEAHVENPEGSALFSPYPRIQKDHFAMDLICDTLRMMTMSFEDPDRVKTMMDNVLEKHHHETVMPAHAMHHMADGIPALGIVAAVLGVIKTMASIDQPVEILGAMIGGALVGTFLGVFMAYGFVGPIADKLDQIYEQEHQFYLIIRDVLVSHLQGNAPQISVEIGRGGIPTKLQPSFAELEEALNSVTVPG